jgi:hypothetical protein
MACFGLGETTHLEAGGLQTSNREASLTFSNTTQWPGLEAITLREHVSRNYFQPYFG